jgi:hypothetical protein
VAAVVGGPFLARRMPVADSPGVRWCEIGQPIIPCADNSRPLSGVPLDEMDEGDVRHTAASVKVSDAADPKASHSRSCDSTDRLHL